MKFLLLFSLLFVCKTTFAGEQLLRQAPKAYPKYAAFNNKRGSCRNVIEPTRQKLLNLRKKGHKLALITTSGSPIKMSPYRIKDVFQGRDYADINSYLEALETYARRNTSYSEPQGYREAVKACVRGHRRAKLGGETCVERSNLRYFHMGFVILDRRYGDQPFVVHFYGDPRYKFLKASIFVETLSSYLQEDRLSHCDATILTVGRRMENQLMRFFKGDHAQRLLAQGNNSYNLVAHPWGIKSQNCNIWVSEVMASAYFVGEESWSRVDRLLAKRVLSQTHFKPVKVPMTVGQSLGRIAAPFINGLNGEEGNIDHFYGVADIVPARSIFEWLERLGEMGRSETIYGQE